MSQACDLRRAEIMKITRRGGGRSLAARDSGPSYLRSTRRVKGALLVGILIAAVCGVARNALGQTSQWVFVGPDGKLAYKTLPAGDRIMDFSFAGYKGGGVALPFVSAVQTMSPSGQDDTAAIQAAIDAVSGRSPDANGIRGAVLLAAGTFNCSGALRITASGVVLRGSGSGPDGTTINMTGSPHIAISIQGAGSWQTVGSSASIADSYVPSGVASFSVDNLAGFSVGDTVLVNRPVTQAWVHFMGMDTLTRDGKPQTWISAGTIIHTDRTITAISGNRITLDVPLADSFDSTFLNPPGGKMVKYTFPGRISQVGIEHLRIIAPPLNVDITHPQFQGFSMEAVIDAWAQDILIQDTQNSVGMGDTAKQVTLDAIRVNHTVPHTGDRMSDFNFTGTQILLNKSSSDGVGEWPITTSGRSNGPYVALNFTSTEEAGIAPHQRWATGLLADGCSLPNAPGSVNGGTTGIAFSDRGNHGSGHGWDMGWGVAWNVTSPNFLVQQPPGAQNWCIGCVGRRLSSAEPGTTGPLLPDGIYDSLGTHVTPSSLYLAQLCERLGPAAVANIGYNDGCAAPASPDFSLGFDQPTITASAPAKLTLTVSINRTGGFTGNVTVTPPSTLPPGIKLRGSDPVSTTGNAASFRIKVKANATPGTYPLVFSGKDDTGRERDATLTVVIQ